MGQMMSKVSLPDVNNINQSINTNPLVSKTSLKDPVNPQSQTEVQKISASIQDIQNKPIKSDLTQPIQNPPSQPVIPQKVATLQEIPPQLPSKQELPAPLQEITQVQEVAPVQQIEQVVQKVERKRSEGNEEF